MVLDWNISCLEFKITGYWYTSKTWQLVQHYCLFRNKYYYSFVLATFRKSIVFLVIHTIKYLSYNIRNDNLVYLIYVLPSQQTTQPSLILSVNVHKCTIICDRACKNRSSEHKKSLIFVVFLYHNIITIYTTATKSSSLLQNLMGFPLQLTEIEYCILNGRY